MRKARGLTQLALTQLARVPRLKVIQAERGDPRVSIAAYAEIARALGAELAIVPVRRPTLDETKALFADAE
jgi:transcriptional regulator with XRE-family HTH domain